MNADKPHQPERTQYFGAVKLTCEEHGWVALGSEPDVWVLWERHDDERR